MLALVVAAAAIALGGMLLGFRLAGPTSTETALGRVSFEVAPSPSGNTEAFVPVADWGFRANTFTAPFTLDVELRAINRKGAVEVAGGDEDAVGSAEAELEDAAKSAVLRAFGWGLGTVVVLALVIRFAVRRFPWRTPLAILAVAFAAVGAAASLISASRTFDADALAAPEYFGRGQELAQILAFAERQQGNDRYTAGFSDALTNFSAYLSNTPTPDPDKERRVLFGSDIHNNALVLDALDGFAEGQPLLLAGDFAHEGNETEARLVAPPIAKLSDEVVAISGNHDSDGMMRALERAGVEVLGTEGKLGSDGEYSGDSLIEVGDFTVAGFSDPLEWHGSDPESPDRVFSFPELPDGEDQQAQAEEDLVEWFEALPEQPDIVLVHQSSLAQHLAAELFASGYDQPLTIVTGHNHYQHIDRYGSIHVVNAGTLGAGGVLRVGQESAGIGQIHFGAGTALPFAVDLIQIEPLSGRGSAERVIPDVVCPDEDTVEDHCHYEPGDS